MTSNLVADVRRRPDSYTPSCKRDSSCWNQPFAGFYVWNQEFAQLSGNVVAGSDDSGYVV